MGNLAHYNVKKLDRSSFVEIWTIASWVSVSLLLSLLVGITQSFIEERSLTKRCLRLIVSSVVYLAIYILSALFFLRFCWLF